MDITKPAQLQLEAYNNKDIDAFMTCYATDVIVEDARGNVLMRGNVEMRKNYSQLFSNSPQLHCELLSRKTVGNYVIDEERVTGRAGLSEARHVFAIYEIHEDGLIHHVKFLR